jgi:recombination protein RecA
MAEKKKAPIRRAVRDVVLENLKGFVRKGSDLPPEEFITTGHLSLDLAIAHGINPDKADLGDVDLDNPGGLPLGRLVEIYGTEGSGKSSIAYRICGFAQKMGYNCLWIDAENSFSHDLARISDVNTSELGLSTLYDEDDPDKIYYAEEIMENICVACRSGYQVIVLDSIAALATRAEMENEIGQGGVGMGALAQLLSRSVKKVCNYAAKFNVLVIMINQVREKIGVSFGDPETTPGGRAVRFHASVRLRFQKQSAKDGSVYVEGEDGEKNLIAGKSYVQIKKNRHGKPVRDSEGKDVSLLLPIYYENYFPDIEEVLYDQGRLLNEPGTKGQKIIKVRNNLYSFGELKASEPGKAGFLKAIKEADAVDALVEAVRNAATESGTLLPPEVLKYQPAKKKPDKKVADDDGGDEAKVSRRRKAKDSSAVGGDSVDAAG